MHKKRLIGLAGPAGVGKDTVAEIWAVVYQFEKYAFAKPLKKMLLALGIDEPTSRAKKEAVSPEWGFSYRKAAQLLGTEWGRALRSDMWLFLAQKEIDQHSSLCITDIRFENEADLIRKNGGVVFHVSGRETTINKENQVHISEVGIDRAPNDLAIDNSKDIPHLLGQILQAMNKLTQRDHQAAQQDRPMASATRKKSRDRLVASL